MKPLFIKKNGTAHKISGLSTRNHAYSNNEQIVGTWTNGKPLYEKTLEFEASSSSWTDYPHGISNIDKIYFAEGMYHRTTETEAYFGLQYSDSSTTIFSLSVDSSNIHYRINNSSFGSGTMNVTLRYTKTTD